MIHSIYPTKDKESASTMSYTHLTKTELIFIEEYFSIGYKGHKIATKLGRGPETVYRIIRKINQGKTAIEISSEYKQNKRKCGRKPIELPQDEIDYINEKLSENWTPDIIIGRKEKTISCSMKTLYRMFTKGIFSQDKLPMKGKRNHNGHQEKRGKQDFRRTIDEREQEHPTLKKNSAI